MLKALTILYIIILPFTTISRNIVLGRDKNKAKQNYNVIKRECYSVLKALKKVCY